MIKIGNKEVIFNQGILIDAINQETWITAIHNGEEVRLCFAFEDTHVLGNVAAAMNPPPVNIETSVTVEAKEDHARVVLRNWSRHLAAASQAMQIGKLNNGSNIFLIVDCARIGTVSKLTVQIMIEVPHG